MSNRPKNRGAETPKEEPAKAGGLAAPTPVDGTDKAAQDGQEGPEPTGTAGDSSPEFRAETQAAERPTDQARVNEQTITRTVGDALSRVTLTPAESEEDARRREQGIEASKAALEAKPDFGPDTPRTPGVRTDATEPRSNGEDGNMQPVTPTADNKTEDMSTTAGPGVAVGDQIIVKIGDKQYRGGVIAVHPAIDSAEDPAIAAPITVDVKVFTGNPARAGFDRIEGIPIAGTDPRETRGTVFGGPGTTEGTPAPIANG